MSYIKSFIKKVVEKLRFGLQKCIAIPYVGNRFCCSCCGGHFRKMKPHEAVIHIKGKLIDHYTENAICPICGSDIRHRFLMTFLKNNTNILKVNIKLLHFAPEIAILNFLKKRKNIEYFPCVINPDESSGVRKMDIRDIRFSDSSFDVVIASHVLEHIKEDTLALKELYRVIKVGGWVIILLPIYGEKTFEDDSLDYNGREMMYGIGEHMRLNGLDFKVKLQNAGFHVVVYSWDNIPGNYVDRSVYSAHTESDKYLFFARK